MEEIIRRRSCDPYMFYRVPEVETDRVRDPTLFQCFNPNPEILELAKKIMQINFITIILLMAIMPHNIYNFIVYLQSSVPTKTLVPSLVVSRLIGLIQLPFVILFPYSLYKKLLNKRILWRAKIRLFSDKSVINSILWRGIS